MGLGGARMPTAFPEIWMSAKNGMQEVRSSMCPNNEKKGCCDRDQTLVVVEINSNAGLMHVEVI